MQQAVVVDGYVVDLLGLMVEVQRGHVEVVAVGCSAGVGDERVEELAEPVLVVPVGHGGQVDDGVGVGLFGDDVGDAQQLDEVLDRPSPGHVRRPRGNLGLVPDGPMVDAASVTGDDGAYEAGPPVVGVVGGQV